MRASSTCRRQAWPQALKLISVKGCEKIARFAFAYARSEGRSSVACATKANIMKFSEGTLKRVFETGGARLPGDRVAGT